MKNKNSKVKRLHVTTNKLSRFEQNISIILKLEQFERVMLKNALDYYLKVEKSEGKDQAIKIAKETRRIISRYSLYQKHKVQMGPRWIKCNSKGIPSYLKLSDDHIKSLRTCGSTARRTLSILSYFQLSLGSVDYDIKSVTESNSSLVSKEAEDIIEPFIPKILKTLKIKEFNISTLPVSPFYVTTKAGAYASKAMGVTSLFDLEAIISEGISQTIFKLAHKTLSNRNYIKFVKVFTDSFDSIKPDINKKLKASARHHFISEGGGKTRVITIGDIWSQSALLPIHNFIMNNLKKITWDGTSSHNNLAIKLRDWTTDESFYCYDLTAATDRMPISLQKRVLNPIFGEEITNLWSTLLVDRNINSNGELIRYAVGQPMGFLSSWAAMALTHHIIINYAYEVVGISPDKRRYCVIGDDMAISNKEAAMCYVDMLERLGMKISLGKSIVPSHDNRIHSAEIAKRFFRNGVEITPITPDQVLLATNSLEDLLALDRTLSNQSYYHPVFHTEDNEDLVLESCPGSLDRQSVLSSCVKNMRRDERLAAYIYFASPVFLQTVPDSDYWKGSTIEGPISWLTDNIWKKVSSFKAAYQQFLLVTVAKKIIHYEEIVQKDKIQMNKIKNSEFGELNEQDVYSPLVLNYFSETAEEMKKIIRVYNTSYIDEEGDDDSLYDITDPNHVLFEILSRPNPLDKPLFQRRSEAKVKQFKLLLIQFLEEQPTVKIPKLNDLEKEA